MNTDIRDKVKAILDRECYYNVHAKQCDTYDRNVKIAGYPHGCWVCHRNDGLAIEIAEVGMKVIYCQGATDAKD